LENAVHLLPSWVESDPLRGRAIDPLGLQETADGIADVLLPGLSVLTRRARYYALLAWARRVCGRHADEGQIHRLEVALAVREAKLHPKETVSDGEADPPCQFVGSRNLPRAPKADPYEKPPEPREAYRVPVWRAYRASMQSLELLDYSYALTDDGGKLAKAFSAACKPDPSGRTMLPESACLSRITFREGALLEERLGIRRKGKLDDNSRSPRVRRGLLEREVRSVLDLDGSLSPASLLERYERRRDREPSFTVGALREAGIWERLSVGLHAAFLLWLTYIRTPGIAEKMLNEARGKRSTQHPRLVEIKINDEAATLAIQSVRRALDLRERLEKCGGLQRCDPKAFELGEALAGTASIGDVLAGLEGRHGAFKGVDAWIRPRGQGKELARDADDKWQLPTVATLHGYRLAAFGQILRDLRRARE